MQKIDWRLTIKVWVFMALMVVLGMVVFVQLSELNQLLLALCTFAVMFFLGLYLNIRERTLNERQYCRNRFRVAEWKAGLRREAVNEKRD